MPARTWLLHRPQVLARHCRNRRRACVADRRRLAHRRKGPHRIARHNAVTGDRAESGFGHRVDDARCDEVDDVARVGIGRILCRSRCPQRPLDVGTSGRQRLPPAGREDLLVALIGQAGIRDGRSPSEGGGVGSPDLSSCMSTAESTRETKKEATDWMVVQITTFRRACSMPSRNASITSS